MTPLSIAQYRSEPLSISFHAPTGDVRRLLRRLAGGLRV